MSQSSSPRYMNCALLAVCAGAVLFTGCQKKQIPTTVAKPVVPPLVSTVPSLSPLDQQAIQPEETKLPFMVRTDLAALQRSIGATFPERIPYPSDGGPASGVADMSRTNADKGGTLTRQGDPQVKIQDGLVVVHANYLGASDSSASDSCRGVTIPVSVDATGQVQIVPHQEQVLLQYVPTRMNVSPAAGNVAGCDGRHDALKAAVEQAMQPQAVTSRVSSSADAVALPVAGLWRDLSAPFSTAVPSLNSRLCFYGQPTELTFGRPQGTGDQSTLRGTARQAPMVTYEQSCRTPSRTPMKVTAGESTLTSTADTPYRLTASIPVSYHAFNQAFEKRLYHHTITLEKGDPAVIEKVSMIDAKGRVLVPVVLSGGLNGTIYYWGTPQLTGDGRAVRVPDLEMAQESKQALDTFHLGYWQVVDQSIRNTLREAAMVDIGPQVDNVKRSLSGTHKFGDTTVEMLLAGQRPQFVRTTHEGLAAYYLFEGTAGATGNMAAQRNTSRPDQMVAPPAVNVDAQPTPRSSMPSSDGAATTRGQSANDHRIPPASNIKPTIRD